MGLDRVLLHDQLPGDLDVGQPARCDRLAPAASEAAYRVVQEALTNALKHAPGAPVDIIVRSQGAEVAVDVVNAPGRQRPSGLERSGSGLGLAGMRDRVAACGGSLACGPTEAGGWRRCCPWRPPQCYVRMASGRILACRS